MASSMIQKHILYKAVSNPIFSKDILPKTPLTVFEGNDIYKDIANIIKRYYQTNSKVLTEEALLTLTEDKLDRMKKSSEEQQRYFSAINEIYEIRNSHDDEVIDEKIEAYIKKHMRMELLKRAAMNLENEQFMENIDKEFKEVMLLDVSGRKQEVINIIDDAETKRRALLTLHQNTISTGYKSIDHLNGGGLARGELGMIVAASGSGKCVKGNTLTLTEKGIIEIQDIPKYFNVNPDTNESEVYVASYTEDGEYTPRHTSHWYNLGKSKTIKVTTKSGFSVEGTPEHPLLVRNKEGNLVYRELQDLKNGDCIALAKGTNMWADENLVSEEEAYTMALSVEENKVIPHKVLQSSKAVVKRFIQGMFDMEGDLLNGCLILTTPYKRMAEQLQIVLLNFGVCASLKEMKVKENEQDKYYVVCISGNELVTFHKDIGFRFHAEYRALLADIVKKESSSIISSVLQFDPIERVEESESVVYDFTVPETHSFVANGIVSHNTLLLTNFAANYVRGGYNVLFVALEELQNRMILRFEQAILRQPRSSFLVNGVLNEEYFDKMQKLYRLTRANFGNLLFARYSPRTVTPAKIEQLISDIKIRQGVDIDVVIIDYPELLRNPHATGNEADDGGKLFEEMRRIGQDYNVVMWTAAQMNRTAYSASVRTAEHIEGSHRKKNTAELVLTVNQTPEEYKAGFIRLYADKVRNPPDGPFDRMLGFKVLGSAMYVRDYEDGEEQEHNRLLHDLEGRVESEIKKRKHEKKVIQPEYGDEINKALRQDTWAVVGK